MPTLDCLHRHIFLLYVYRSVSLALMRRYMQLAYLFHQCAKSLLGRDSRIADCTVRHPGVESSFSSLNLFLEADGLVRREDKVNNIPLHSYGDEKSILAHKASHITTFLICDSHQQSGHMGLNYIVNFLRQAGCWILRIRQTVSVVLKGCFACKRLNAKYFKPPHLPALPSTRVNFSRPFTVAGLGFTRHFFVLGPFGNRQKIYLLIFADFNSLAIDSFRNFAIYGC